MTYIKVETILFSGKQNIPWKAVERYAARYFGMTVQNKEYGDKIRIGASFADEFTQSRYTRQLRGGLAKTKANIVQVVPQLIESAMNRRWLENKNDKHNGNAKGGWYRYDVFFAMPVKAENEAKLRWNNYRATLVVRINDSGLFLYDIINIKKEARKPRDSQM